MPPDAFPVVVWPATWPRQRERAAVLAGSLTWAADEGSVEVFEGMIVPRRYSMNGHTGRHRRGERLL